MSSASSRQLEAAASGAASARHQLTSSPLAASALRASRSDDEDDANQEAQEQEEETASSDSEIESSTTGRKQRQRIHFDVQTLQGVYHLPLKTAAERLGVCEAALKRICRRNRIHKWPYRQLSSVRRRIAELKDRRYAHSGSQLEIDGIGGRQRSGEHGVADALSSETPAQFDDQLRRLEEEHAQIIRSANETRPSNKSSQLSNATSSHQLPQQQPQGQEAVPADSLIVHLRSFHSSTAADLPPLDITRVDRDFPLLFLANVCESVRAHH